MEKIETIVHLADIHYRNFQRHNEYRAICSNFIDQMKRIKPDRIVIVGDVVHLRNQLTPELVKEVSWFFSECSKVTKKVIVIPGNHDIVEQNKERMDALTPILYALNCDNIVYYTKSSSNIDENVNWVVYSLYNNNVGPEWNKTPGLVNIGLYHGIINGSTNNLGFKFTYGVELDEFEKLDLVLCGDIHKRQIFKTKSNAPVIMVGSLIQQDFSETVNEHGFNIIKINDNKISYSFQDIPNPVKYLNFKINDFSDIENGEEILTNG
jgi:DNA repair exonuclease SbcCD nuclease subunit